MIAYGPAGTFQAPEHRKEPTCFTVYWRHNRREVLEGSTIEEAFSRAGYGNGAVKAVDFYVPGLCDRYVWCKNTHQWHLKPPVGSVYVGDSL